MNIKKKIEKRYIVFIILILISLILGGLFYVFNKKRNLIFFERGIKDIGVFTEKVIYAPIHYLRKQFNEYKEKENMYEEYDKMKKNYDKYITLENKYNEKIKEIAELESLLQINANLSEGTYVNVTTINRNVDYWYQNITIDKGKKEKIDKGDAVINSKGLIGYIDKTANHSSTVKLLTANDINHKISVKIEVGTLYVYGLLTYYDKDKNLYKIEGISENTGIPKDSKVTTTGLGNKFPSGLLVGYVNDTSLDNFELAKTVYVKPAVNFNDITYLTVIKKEYET